MHQCGGSRHVSGLVGIANSDFVVGTHLARSRKTLIVITVAASETMEMQSIFPTDSGKLVVSDGEGFGGGCIPGGSP
jgi:hypothetical protein